MQKIITFIVGLGVIFAIGHYYFTARSFQNPLAQHQRILNLPDAKQAAAFQETLHKWVTDPVSAIPYPKGWEKVSVTNGEYTYDVVTSDEKRPPQFYAAFAFPKELIPEMNLIKCIGTGEKKPNDICIVGDNPQINAYFTLIEWFKTGTREE